MNGPDAPAWFVGDLDDPWVSAIAEALPRTTKRLSCGGELPDSWPDDLTKTATLILHRPLLTSADTERVRRLRELDGRPPRVVLCFGPHTRYRDLERWSPLVDAMLPEATAAETVARYVQVTEDIPRPTEPRPPVTVVSSNHELRLTLRDACEEAGYRVCAAPDWTTEIQSRLAVWDVPVLEDDWPTLLGRQARSRRVLALLGIADRVTVGLARAQGAAACLDLPCDPADLVFVLDRLARSSPAHTVPPASAALRRAHRHPGERHKPPEQVVADPRRES